MWLVPEFVISLFGIASRERHLAIAKDAFWTCPALVERDLSVCGPSFKLGRAQEV